MDLISLRSYVAEAINENDYIELSELIEDGDVLDVEDDLGTPLHAAVLKQRLKCVKVILQHPRCRINEQSIHKYSTSLYEACISYPFSFPIAEELLRNGADPNLIHFDQISPLHRACERGHLKLVKLLLKKGAKLNHTAFNNFTALHFAVDNHQLEIVEFLLKNNANTEIQDIFGLNPLMISIKRRFVHGFRLLLPVTKNLNCSGEDNKTAISLATLEGDKEMVYKLLEKNVNVNSCDKNCPFALSELYSDYNFEIFQELWSRADFNILSKNEHFKIRLKELTVQDNLLFLKHVLQTQNPEFKRLNSEVKLFEKCFLINHNTSVSEEYFEKHKNDLFSILHGLYKQEIIISNNFMELACNFIKLCPYRLELLQFFIAKFDFPIDSKLICFAFSCNSQIGYCMLRNCSNPGREFFLYAGEEFLPNVNKKFRSSSIEPTFKSLRESGLINNLFSFKSVKSLVEISRNVVRECVCEATLNNRKEFCAAIKTLQCPDITKDILLFKVLVNNKHLY